MARPLLALALALAVPLAGCLTASQPPAPPGDGDRAAEGAYALDCALGPADDPCVALASPNDSPSKTEIDIAVNPTDPRNVFVASKDLDPVASDCVWSVGEVTKDAGRTWSTVYVGGTKEDRALPTHPLYGWTCITDPIMAFDAAGVLYYPLQAYTLLSEDATCVAEDLVAGTPLQGAIFACGSAFFLAVSRDGGATFPEIVPMAVAEGNVVFHDYPRMAVSPATQSVSTVWNAVGNAGVTPYVVTTRDGGRTVDPPVLAAPPEGTGTTAFASGYAAGPDGTFYMTVYRFGPGFEGSQAAYLATSTDDARSFGGFAKMFDLTPIECPLPNTEFRCGTSVELAADVSDGPRRGRLYAIWDDGREGHADVLSAWSDDGGATWSEPVRVNQDATASAQWMARVDVDGQGTVHVLYMDRSHDPGDRLYDLTWAWSADGGATWAHRRVTNVSSDGDLGIHQNGFPFIGDYNGLDATGGHVWMGFPTTRTGRAEIGVAHVAAPADPAEEATSSLSSP